MDFELAHEVACRLIGGEMKTENGWTLAEAVELCVLIESICPKFGCHVALTGGTLYKTEPRKDCDVLFYRIRQVERIDIENLFPALSHVGITMNSGFGWVYKGEFNGKKIDFFFPDEPSGDYPEEKAEGQQ